MDRVFKALFIAAFINAVTWIVVIPIWQYPDEQAHFSQVQNLAEIGFVPPSGPNTSYEISLSEEILDTARDGSGNNKFVYHPEYKISYSNDIYGPRETEILNLPKSARTQMSKQESTINPPLYYLSASSVYKIFKSGSLFDRVIAVRLLSLTLFMGLLITSYKIALIVFEDNKLFQLTLVTLIAFKPMLIFSSTGVLADPLTNLLFSLVILMCLRVIKSGITSKSALIIFLIVLLGFQTRQQFIISLPIILTSILIRLLLIKNYKSAVIIILSILILPIIVYLFPKILVIAEIGFPNLTLILKQEFITSLNWTIRHTYAEVLPWYWGVYKWLSFTLPHPFYQVINRIILFSVIGLSIYTYQFIRRRKIQQSDIYIAFLIFSSLFYYFVFTVADYFFQNQYHYTFGIQGRYFFPLVTAHMVIILTGLITLVKLIPKKFQKFTLLCLPLAMIIFNFSTLYYLLNSFYETTSLKTLTLQLSQYKPYLLKGNNILIILVVSSVLNILYAYKLVKTFLKNDL